MCAPFSAQTFYRLGQWRDSKANLHQTAGCCPGLFLPPCVTADHCRTLPPANEARQTDCNRHINTCLVAQSCQTDCSRHWSLTLPFSFVCFHRGIHCLEGRYQNRIYITFLLKLDFRRRTWKNGWYNIPFNTGLYKTGLKEMLPLHLFATLFSWCVF